MWLRRRNVGGCLDDKSTHKTTLWHFSMHGISTQRFVCCDVLLLWHFDPITFYSWNILSLYCFTVATFHLCNILLLLTFHLCNVLLLQPFVSVTFYFCNILTPTRYVQATEVYPLLRLMSIHIGHPFFTGLWQDVHLCSEAKCGCFVTCQRGTPGSILAYLAGGEQYGTRVKFRAVWWWDIAECMDQLSVCPNLT